MTMVEGSRSGETVLTTAAAPLSRLKTLLVDDDATSRELMRRILEILDYDVKDAASAEYALSCFEKYDPDVVIMDIILPGMDGVKAMREMKRRRNDRWLPVLLVSVKSTGAEVLAGLRAGADDYLTKPVAIEQVAAKMRNIGQSLTLHAQVRTSLKFARAVTTHMLEGLLCVDAAGLVLATNPAAERMFGYPPGTLVGVNVSRLIERRDEGEADGPSSIGRAISIGRRADSSRFPFEAQQTRVEIEEREVTLLTLHDISKQLAEERRILSDAAKLREYRLAHEMENDLAHEVLDRLLYRGDSGVDAVRWASEAATGFSGDVVAVKRSPSGRVFVMLADATGHGLAAAISLVPALSAWHAMVERDCELSAIVAELNAKTKSLMPVGRFLAAALVCLDEQRRLGEIWVGGVPALLLLGASGSVERRFDSCQLPLGIVDSTAELAETVAFGWEAGQDLVMVSDGLLEADDPNGSPFGEAGVIAALAKSVRGERVTCVMRTLRAHLAGLASSDDASIAVIELD